MTIQQILFILIALTVLGSALLVVTTRNLFHAALVSDANRPSESIGIASESNSKPGESATHRPDAAKAVRATNRPGADR